MDHKGEYDKYAFIIMDAHTDDIVKIIRLKSNEERLRTIKDIRSKGQYLFYAMTHQDEKTKKLTIQRPFVVDFDSVPSAEESKCIENDIKKLSCKKCGKSFTSASGLTNHLNVKH